MAYYNYGIIDQNSNPKKDGSVEGFSEVIYAPFTIEINGISYTNPSNDKLRKAGYFPIETRDRIGGDSLLPANYIYFYEGTGNDKKIIKYVYYFGSVLQPDNSSAPDGSNNIDSIIGEGGSGGSGGSVDIGDIPASDTTIPSKPSWTPGNAPSDGSDDFGQDDIHTQSVPGGQYKWPFVLNKTIDELPTNSENSTGYKWLAQMLCVLQMYNRLTRNDYAIYNAISDQKKEIDTVSTVFHVSSTASGAYEDLSNDKACRVVKNLNNSTPYVNNFKNAERSLSDGVSMKGDDFADYLRKFYDSINVDQQIIYNAIREKLLSIKQKIESGNIGGGSSDLDTICKSIAFALSNQYSYDIVADYKQSVEMRESEKEYEESQTEEAL